MSTLRNVTGSFAVLLAAFGSSGCYSFTHVGSGEMAVVHTPEGAAPKPLPPGDFHIGYADTATDYSVRSQEHGEQLDVLSSDGLRIVLDASIRYHAVPGEVVALDRELGPDYYDVLLGPTLRSQARRVVGRFRPEEIYSSQRELIEKQIREGIDQAIKGRHIELEAVLIRNVTLPGAIQAAINDKLEKEQAALKMKYVEDEQKAQDRVKLMQANDEAEQQKIAAQSAATVAKIAADSDAQVKKIQAQAGADAKKVEGQGVAEYQRAVQPTLTPQVLRMREIQASKALAESPNAKIVLGAGSNARTLLDLRGAGGGPADGSSPYP
ncbi:MAG TPA: prohibitin family protein [Polyangiaceae bacterium]|jgi:regulator of protease activity HflC (stomatin/prohibitin superfamily)